MPTNLPLPHRRYVQALRQIDADLGSATLAISEGSCAIPIGDAAKYVAAAKRIRLAARGIAALAERHGIDLDQGATDAD